MSAECTVRGRAVSGRTSISGWIGGWAAAGAAAGEPNGLDRIGTGRAGRPAGGGLSKSAVRGPAAGRGVAPGQQRA